jgi:3-phenylpropionate/trans-cinnamate dioxygenase ferredoxin reductase subunit
MADRQVDVLVVGGGIAAASCAAALREEGFGGSVLVAGRELDPPYHRPPVSKGLLRGTATKEEGLIHPEDFWAGQDIELLTRTSVLGLDLDARTAKLSTKQEIGFTQALVATGAMVRRLPIEGTQLDGVHYLRAPGNAQALREDVAAAEEVVCIGGSFIGCEVAASLTAMGKRVAIVMQEDEPLERAFGRLAGARVRALLEEHGVTVHGGAEVQRLAGEERVAAVVLADGRELPAQAVVLGVGATPDVMLAKKAGLPIGQAGGVVCSENLMVEGVEGVFAAGDMCEFRSVLHGDVVRIEHEEVAAAQGAHVARVIAGRDAPFAVVPYFWSDLADWATLEQVSVSQRWDEEQLVEGPDGSWGVRYAIGERLVGAVSCGGAIDLDATRVQLTAQTQ